MANRPDRPNILLLVLDALRADALEPYGAPPGASPTLRQLAGEGLAVPDVRATASWTLPSHMAMFTGQLARGLGLGQAPGRTPQGAAPVVRAQRSKLLAEVLRHAGYETRAVTANGWVGPVTGFDTGFDEFTEPGPGRQSELGGGARHRLKWDWEAVRARADDGAAEVANVLARWLDLTGEKPFFWFVNLVECHSPYLPPAPYTYRSPISRARAGDEAFRYLTFGSILLAWLGRLSIPPAAIERMQHLYRASLRYLDDWLARLWDLLSGAGAWKDTLVIVCSDHGENFGVSGLMGHGMSLDDRLLRVPFIVTGPGSDAFRGMRSLAELPSRMSRAVDMASHPWSDGLVAGLPVAQWDRFDISEQRLAELVTQWELDADAVERLTTPLTCAVSDQLKLVRGASDADEWLYDLKDDPRELTPLRGEAMRSRAGPELARLRTAVNHPAAQATVEVSARSEPGSSEVEELERKMRLMGYM